MEHVESEVAVETSSGITVCIIIVDVCCDINLCPLGFLVQRRQLTGFTHVHAMNEIESGVEVCSTALNSIKIHINHNHGIRIHENSARIQLCFQCQGRTIYCACSTNILTTLDTTIYCVATHGNKRLIQETCRGTSSSFQISF